MYCTGESRLIKRNGECILQQKWADGFTLDEPKPPEWRDVPCEPEPKTECKMVFNGWVQEEIDKLEKEGNQITSIAIRYKTIQGNGLELTINIPYKTPEPKTERQKVCDEILEWIKDDFGYIACDGLRIKINQIKNHK